MDNRKATIESLLYKAARTDNKEEADAYKEKANYLAIKWGILDAQARHKEHSNEVPESEIFRLGNPHPAQRLRLLTAIAKYLGIKLVRSSNLTTGSVWAFGYKTDLEQLKTLYFSITAQMFIEMCSAPIPTGVHGKTFRHSWLLGFIKGVDDRMYMAYNRAIKEVGNTVALRNRDNEIEKVISDMFPNTKKTYDNTAASDLAGWAAGHEQGLKADIGQDRISRDQHKRSSQIEC